MDDERPKTLAEQGKNLHFEVATGIAQILFLLHCRKDEKSIPLSDLYQTSCSDKSERATRHITEFIFEALPQVTPELIAAVVAGDYSQVWANTNEYLKHFGLEPVEPEAIDI